MGEHQKNRGPRRQYVQRSLRFILDSWDKFGHLIAHQKPVSFLDIGDAVGIKTSDEFRNNGYAAPQANAICQSMARFGLACKTKDHIGRPALLFKEHSKPSPESILDMLDRLPEYSVLAERFGWVSPPPEAVIASNLVAADGFSPTAARQLAKAFSDDLRMLSRIWFENGIQPHWRWASLSRRDGNHIVPPPTHGSHEKTASCLTLLASIAVGPVSDRETCELFISLPPEKLDRESLLAISEQVASLARG